MSGPIHRIRNRQPSQTLIAPRASVPSDVPQQYTSLTICLTPQAPRSLKVLRSLHIRQKSCSMQVPARFPRTPSSAGWGTLTSSIKLQNTSLTQHLCRSPVSTRSLECCQSPQCDMADTSLALFQRSFCTESVIELAATLSPWFCHYGRTDQALTGQTGKIAPSPAAATEVEAEAVVLVAAAATGVAESSAAPLAATGVLPPGAPLLIAG